MKMISSLILMTDKSENVEVTYKELCTEVYSVTQVTHKDGPVDKNARG